ncbi:OpgC family protein [Lichenifustis flavocetrariae]|uniref:OpgC domain-containing protein n=1 Tax=Lichenifustis flavocetrariae TaxID=2949735 RepID=A0AA42CL91_9HYPH|nr:OpgC domain-containing protein [Lichenifustis flavocetrariae]MCW6507142.1 OpgC domain-containing protein [Lichenifustis flavocetrariae]
MDLLRGIALLSIFVDHIPNNRLADYTLHNFGFSDAAELFVFLAGYSAMSAYSRVFERDGLRVGLAKVYARCVKIYGVQVVLLLLTLATVAQWERFNGTQSVIVGPLLRDWLRGAIRGVTLEALPAYLDILPLYIVLLAIFPVIRYGLAKSVAGTMAISVALHAAANLFHWDLPSFVDPTAVTIWYFNPFTWQLVFVCGAAFAVCARRDAALIVAPPKALRLLCWAYLAFAFWALDPWKLWPQPFGADFPSTRFPFALLGNEPKSFVTPWRLLHVLALTYLALTSPGLSTLSRAWLLTPILACGRQSLYVFAVGCMLALFGRLIFKTVGVTVTTEILVNVVGLTAMLACGLLLDRDKQRQKDPNDRRHLTPARPGTTPVS